MDKEKIINELIFEALNELCSLKNIELNNEILKKIDTNAEEVLKLFEQEPKHENINLSKHKTFQDILKDAKLKSNEIKNNKDRQLSKREIEELEIIEQARREGKTEYDPDILRKLILLRQKYKQNNS